MVLFYNELGGLLRSLTDLEKEFFHSFASAVNERASTKGVRDNWTFSYFCEACAIPKAHLSKDGHLSPIMWIYFLMVTKFFIPATYPFKYMAIADFVREYTPRFDNHSDREKMLLMRTANWMNILFDMVPAKKNKGLAINVIPKVLEGLDVRYVTGSGQTCATADRVFIYEHEGVVVPYQRRRKPGPDEENGNIVDGQIGDTGKVKPKVSPLVRKEKKDKPFEKSVIPKKSPSHHISMSQDEVTECLTILRSSSNEQPGYPTKNGKGENVNAYAVAVMNQKQKLHCENSSSSLMDWPPLPPHNGHKAPLHRLRSNDSTGPGFSHVFSIDMEDPTASSLTDAHHNSLTSTDRYEDHGRATIKKRKVTDFCLFSDKNDMDGAEAIKGSITTSVSMDDDYYPLISMSSTIKRSFDTVRPAYDNCPPSIVNIPSNDFYTINNESFSNFDINQSLSWASTTSSTNSPSNVVIPGPRRTQAFSPPNAPTDSTSQGGAAPGSLSRAGDEPPRTAPEAPVQACKPSKHIEGLSIAAPLRCSGL